MSGFAGKSKKGELSVFPTKIVLLAPCLHMLPDPRMGLKSQEVCGNQRQGFSGLWRCLLWTRVERQREEERERVRQESWAYLRRFVLAMQATRLGGCVFLRALTWISHGMWIRKTCCPLGMAVKGVLTRTADRGRRPPLQTHAQPPSLLICVSCSCFR